MITLTTFELFCFEVLGPHGIAKFQILTSDMSVHIPLAYPWLRILLSSYYKTRPNSRPDGDFVPKKISDPPKLLTRWEFPLKINCRPGPIKVNPGGNVYNIKEGLKEKMDM